MRLSLALISFAAAVALNEASSTNNNNVRRGLQEEEDDPRKIYQTMSDEDIISNWRELQELTSIQPEEGSDLYNMLGEMLISGKRDYVRTWPIPVQEIWKKVPNPPGYYPEAMQGVWWMDQYGYYGHADTEGAAENLLSFGETDFYEWDDKEPNFMYVSGVCGGAWVMEASTQAGQDYASGLCHPRVGKADALGGVTRFTFTDDFSMAYFDVYAAGLFRANPKYIGVMYLQNAPEGACPPAENATKYERNLCAKWIRRSWAADNTNLTDPYFDYPVFQIADSEGIPIEPYFSAYVESMLSRNNTHSQMGHRVSHAF